MFKKRNRVAIRVKRLIDISFLVIMFGLMSSVGTVNGVLLAVLLRELFLVIVGLMFEKRKRR